MSQVAFDTLKFAERLESGGFSHQQAKAAAEAFSSATAENIVTVPVLQNELAPVKSDLLLLKWMTGFVLATMVAVLFTLVRH